jgi:hypothetical protein
LVAALESDSSFSDSDPEKVISGRGEWRKPDVSAKLDGRLIAFDIQRATTQLPAIDGREAFYEKYNILYVWIVDTNDTHKLALQAFQDIYWNNRGQIFAFDERARDFSQENNELHLWALTVAPWLADDGVTLVWTKQLVRRSQIDWGSATQHPRYPADTYEQAFDKSVTQKFLEPRRRLINSTRQFTLESIESAGESWNEIANALGAPLWSSARDDQVFKVIGVLATAAAGQKMDASRYAETALTAMFNEFLEHGACRGWTTSLIQIADAYSHTQLLAAKSTQQKMARNLSEQHPDMARRYAGMLDVIFPKSALSRLVGPPTRIVELA